MSYDPRPIETHGVALTPALEALAERLASSTHDAWARKRVEDGWRYGPQRDDARKAHPCLVPYDELPESEKDVDRRVVRDLLRALLALGYRLDPPGAAAAGSLSPSPPATALDLLQTSARLDLRELLALWHARDREAWAGAPEPYARLGERILRLGAPLPAHDVLAEGLAAHPADVRLRQLQALALARSGAAAKAHALLRALFAEGHADGETLGILARTCKDLSAAAADAGARRDWLRQAHERYGDAYRLAGVRQDADGALYTGINAASTALLLGERSAAQRFAREARAWCERRLARSADYWAEATLAEAALILGEWEEAERRYRRAAELGGGNLGDVASTRRQARLLLGHLGRDPGQLDDCFRIGPVVVFAGHRLDRPGRPEPRFPAALAPAVGQALAERLEALGARIGFASAADGADILFLEALLARGGEAHVVLPYSPAQFRADQADAGPGEWDARHARVLAAAAEVVTASEQTRPSGSAVFEYAAALLYGWAKLWAQQLDTPLVPLAVWDGRSGDGQGGTAAAVARWRELGHEVQVIDLAQLRGESGRPPHRARTPVTAPAPPAGSAPLGLGPQTVMAVLFADAVGYSKLTEEQVGRFVEHFLGAVAALAARAADARPAYAPVTRNTWGDGLYLVFKSVREAGRFALDLCDLVDGNDWTAHGLPAGLSLRVALHAGPVYVGRNPVTGLLDYTGTHVSRAARIEPITPPGHVYASRPFAALAAAEGTAEFGCDYVGQTSLAKGYGTFPTYHVRRR
jgi:hypothetical protein